MKFTIIIPVYNVEEYVERCIISCCEQNIDDSEYEVIVVNDGSPDNSLEVVKKVAQKYSNVKIFSQKNQGLSAARNLGLRMAKGEYVWFIDSDDWIEENCIFDLYHKCKEFNLDVLLFDAVEYDGSTFKKRETFDYHYEFPIEGKNYLLSEKIVFSVCFKIFKRDFLIFNSLFFMNGIFHEDNEFIPRAFYHSKRVMRIDRAIYYVFHNRSSITRSVNHKKSFDLIKVARSHANFLQEYVVEQNIENQFCVFIGLALNSALDNMLFMNKENKYHFLAELKINKDLFVLMKRNTNIKYKLEAFLFLLSSSLFLKIYSIFKSKQLFSNWLYSKKSI